MQMRMNILKFCFYFCLQYALTITFYDFDLNFLKTVLKSALHGLLQAIGIIFYNLKRKWLPIPHS